MKSLSKHLLLFSAILLNISAIHSQMELPEDKVKWNFKIEQKDCEATIIGEISIVKNWHIYAAHLPKGSFTIPTDIKLAKSSKYDVVGGIIEPKPHHERDEMADEDLYYHSNSFVLKQKINITAEKNFQLKGIFSFQTCDDAHCLPPFETEFTLQVKGCAAKKTEIIDASVETTFIDNKAGVAHDKQGNAYVQVNEKWSKVPQGNSPEFYKKYLTLLEKDEN